MVTHCLASPPWSGAREGTKEHDRDAPLPDERAARPRISGHRGALAVEPENTIRSFRRAIADGAALVELDLATISGLSAGGEHVPTFPELLADRPELAGRLVLSSFSEEIVSRLAAALPAFRAA